MVDTPAREVEAPKPEKVDGEKFTVESVIDLNNVRLRTKEGQAFYATVKDSTDMKAGDKVEIKSTGSTDGVPYGASVA